MSVEMTKALETYIMATIENSGYKPALIPELVELLLVYGKWEERGSAE